MFRYAFAFLVSVQVALGQTAPQDDVKDALAHAEALYFEARFKDSIQLLTRIDDLLETKPERRQDRINTKMQLALANIGLNETAQAKNYLREIYALDAEYAVSPLLFSPKVLALANEAKAEYSVLRCQGVNEDARQKLAVGNAKALQDILGSMRSKCTELAAIEPAAADLFYKTGVDAYKRGDFADAQQKLRAAVQLAPKHEFAAQYLELTQSKRQVEEDRVILSWRKNFEAQQFKSAAADYRSIVANGGNNAQSLSHMNAEYRKTLSSLVESWNRTCPTRDTATMDSLRKQISELLPEPSFGEDIRAQMTNCKKPEGCVQMSAQLALTRLKVRVNPEISQTLRGFMRNSQVAVRLKTRIDETGNVTVLDAQGENVAVNNAVRNAVERWKFAPAVDQTGPRCVETEIPIIVGP